MANNVDPDQMLHSVVSDLVYTICKGLSVPVHRVIRVVKVDMFKFLDKYYKELRC